MRTFRLGDEQDEAIMRDREARGLPALADGERLVVPAQFMDSMQRDVGQHFAAKRARVTDATGDHGLGLQKPGFRIADGVQRDMNCYAQYDAEAEVAYKRGDDPQTGFGARDAVGQRVGDLCTIDGERGHLRMVDGKLTCVVDRSSDAMPVRDGLTHEQRMSRLYQLRDEELSNAWRNPV